MISEPNRWQLRSTCHDRRSMFHKISSLHDYRSKTHDQRSRTMITAQYHIVSTITVELFNRSETGGQKSVCWPPYHWHTGDLDTPQHTPTTALNQPQGHNLNHQPYPLQPQTPTTTTTNTKEINLLCFCQCVSGLASYLKLHSTSCNMSIKWAWLSKLSNMLSKVEKYVTRVNNSD